MKRLSISSALAVAATLWLFSSAGRAQDPTTARKPGPESRLQAQIEELKEGQRQLRKELEEIKGLLQEKGGRQEFLARPNATNTISVNVHGEPFKGGDRARVAILEYSDFECPFCGKYAREIYPLIDKTYVTTGRIKYFFRDFPEDQVGLFAARAARCAGEQGKFWEIHDRLFAEKFQTSPAPHNFVGEAEAVGLNVEQFQDCLGSGRYADNIKRSVASAKRLGLQGTPAFLLGQLSANGDFLRVTKLFVGTEAFESFKTALEELLAAPPSE